ncbi:MAG: hypothetical protein JWP15_2931 [Alphaproteobacteria bacterium]|nr:hypothetical protein [Alphaproteobacteria bacterium]
MSDPADPIAIYRAKSLAAWRAGDFEACLSASRAVADLSPTSESLCNMAVVLRRLGRDAEARDYLRHHASEIDPIALHDLQCSVAARLGDADGAIRYGNEALRLKDAAASPAPPLRPFTRPFDPTRRNRNIISFSLWGTDRRYVAGAITNAQVAPYLYPAWTPRFYVDESVPDAIRLSLTGLGAQVTEVEGLPADRYGTFWRFLVEDDPDVDFYLIRDADSVSNIKEAWAVSDWLASGSAFHVMRDNLQHAEVILAGMWGAHRGNIGAMDARIRAFVTGPGKDRVGKTLDQIFLRGEVWPIARQSLTQHDGNFDLREPRRYDPAFLLPAGMHIGQNEAARAPAKRVIRAG